MAAAHDTVQQRSTVQQSNKIQLKTPTTRNGSTLSGRILVIDDNRDTRESLSLLLGTMGYTVQTAGDGSTAVSTALSFQPHLAILDVVMPGTNGFKTAELLRKQDTLRDLVIVTTTGWQQEPDDFLSKYSGANYHLLKPLDVGALQQILEKHLTAPTV
jgi:CheY-like chemotaxis protein